MSNLGDLFSIWLEMEQLIDEEVSKLKLKGITEGFESHLKEKFGEKYPNYWYEKLVNPIADEIKQHGSFQKVEVLGPFGVGARVSIHCYVNGTDDISDIKAVTFEPDLDSECKSPLSIVDYSKNTERFAKGTLGYANGLNYPSELVRKETKGAEWLSFLS